MCVKYSDVFFLEDSLLRVTNIYKQSIHLQKSAAPTYVKPHRLAQVQKNEIHKQIDKMLNVGIIEEAKSAVLAN